MYNYNLKYLNWSERAFFTQEQVLTNQFGSTSQMIKYFYPRSLAVKLFFRGELKHLVYFVNLRFKLYFDTFLRL